MKKVMVFGTFDILHKGHLYFLKEAKKKGYLIAVVARDKTVVKVKKQKPVNNEKKRAENLRKIKFVNKVVIGDLKNKFKAVDRLKPDMICLGYDQKNFIQGLIRKIKKRKLKIKIFRIKPFKPEIYKSSKLR